MSTTALLARADLLLVLRQVLSQPDLQAEQSAPTPTEDLAADLGELLTASALPDSLLEPLVEALAAAELAGSAQRAIDLATWDGAGTGLDLHECAYVRRDRGAVMGDVSGFYRAFGVAPGGESQRVDRLGAELEFLGLLYVLHARALTEGAAEHAETVQSATKAFWTDHLAPWIALPSARAALLPTPTWLRSNLLALALVMDELARAEGWVPPSYDDQGEPDADPRADCGIGCAN